MKIKETKKRILKALEGEAGVNPFKIVVIGDSGNCKVTNTEQEEIKKQIAKILLVQNIPDFYIKFYA